jgi:hypothetical protein
VVEPTEGRRIVADIASPGSEDAIHSGVCTDGGTVWRRASVRPTDGCHTGLQSVVNDLLFDTCGNGMSRIDRLGRRKSVMAVTRSGREGDRVEITYLRNHAHVQESRVLLRMVRGNDLGKG